MQSDLGYLRIRKVILHDVPKHTKKEEGEGPILSQVESPLSGSSSLYFKKKIVDSIKSTKAFDITFDAISSSPVPELITEYLTKPTKSLFIKNSQKMAEHLHNIQSGHNPPGFLAVVDCTVDDKMALAIVKLEREEGVRLQQTTVQDKRTFNFDVIKDLIFTEKTRVYKVSLFIALDEELKSMEAAVSDYQTGYFRQADVARFFLRSFLGCTLLEEAYMSTRKFYELSEQFFNEEVKDPTKRQKYYTHLVSTLHSNADSVSPESFAQLFLETPDRKPYLAYIRSQGLNAVSFPLDTRLIDGRLKKQLIEFEEGISIVIRSEDAEERVKWTSLANGQVKAEISGMLKAIKGKG
jgi:hypothetical protein